MRHTAALVCMAAGILTVTVGTLLAFGLPVTLIVVGVAFVGLSVLLGWS
jgi:hypothetical protein